MGELACLYTPRSAAGCPSADAGAPPINTSHQTPRRKHTPKKCAEIGRSNICGWNGCESAFKHLKHLNLHVTQEGHGPRRTIPGGSIARIYACGWDGCVKPYMHIHLITHMISQEHGRNRTFEELGESRKIWKARKQQEEDTRKADEELQSTIQNGGADLWITDQGFIPVQYPLQSPTMLSTYMHQHLTEFEGNHVYDSYPSQNLSWVDTEVM
ncbi:hypothetical protein B0T24DRAFT_310695 [Lasiosphaeria ovina]|uniref:C2H2-type domain-containing protein n=1 Tax=Lasiosphaeria ovina TaxID=92902 RepID=A0AAE0N6H6_9PEZI|nr:hypothetical protein B0T24DRAFT_310695 [Lasiosphaeria ovina]